MMTIFVLILWLLKKAARSEGKQSYSSMRRATTI
jgi:hypothetical protein